MGNATIWALGMVLSCAGAQSQVVEWDSTYTTDRVDWTARILPLAGGGVAMVGSAYPLGQPLILNQGAISARVGPSGKRGFRHTYFDSTRIEFLDATTLPDDRILAVGRTKYLPDSSSSLESKAILIMEDSRGDTLWTRRIDQMPPGRTLRSVSAHTILPVPGSDSLVVFFSQSVPFPYPAFDQSIAMVAPDGGVRWIRSINVAGATSVTVKAVVRTKKGEIYLTGEKSIRSRQNDVYITKLDFQYAPQWTRFYGGAGYVNVEDILETEDGILVAGQAGSEINKSNDTWLFKVDGSGDQLWSKTIDMGEFESAVRMIPIAENRFMVGGYAIPVNGGSSRGIFLMEIGSQGDTLWTNRIFKEVPYYINDLAVEGTDFVYIAGTKDLTTRRTDFLMKLRLDRPIAIAWRKGFRTFSRTPRLRDSHIFRNAIGRRMHREHALQHKAFLVDFP